MRLVGYPIIYEVLYIPGGARFLPSTVFNHFLHTHTCIHEPPKLTILKCFKVSVKQIPVDLGMPKWRDAITVISPRKKTQHNATWFHGRNFGQFGEHLFIQRRHRSAHVLWKFCPDLLHNISLYKCFNKKKDERDKSWNGEILYNDTTGITYIDAWQMLLLILAAMPLSYVLSILESTLWQGNDTENNAKSSKQRTTSWHTQRKTGTFSGVYYWTT